MPNPLTVKVDPDQHAIFHRDASQEQRITLSKGGVTLPTVHLPSKPVDLAPGVWTVLHETYYRGEWRKGRGRKVAPGKVVFDDHPRGGGDKDYNDAVVEIVDKP